MKIFACAVLWAAVQLTAFGFWLAGITTFWVFLAFYVATCTSWVVLVHVKEELWK